MDGDGLLFLKFLEKVWSSATESDIWRVLFQLPLRHTFDYLRHLSTFVCKSLLTYMPSRIDFFELSNQEYDLYGSIPGTNCNESKCSNSPIPSHHWTCCK